MTDTFTMEAILAFAAALVGFACLSLAMDWHYADWFGRGRDAGSKRRWLQAAGSVALYVACVGAQGYPIGSVLWFGVLTAAALVVVLSLTYWPKRTGR